MNLTEYATEMKISKPAALKYVKRLAWETNDGRKWKSEKSIVKGRASWDIQERDEHQQNIQGGAKSLEDLKKEKIAEEVSLLQQRNRDLEELKFRRWCDCLRRGCEKAAMEFAAVPLRLRVDKKNCEEINHAITKFAERISFFVEEEIKECEEEAKK